MTTWEIVLLIMGFGIGGITTTSFWYLVTMRKLKRIAKENGIDFK